MLGKMDASANSYHQALFSFPLGTACVKGQNTRLMWQLQIRANQEKDSSHLIFAECCIKKINQALARSLKCSCVIVEALWASRMPIFESLSIYSI